MVLTFDARMNISEARLEQASAGYPDAPGFTVEDAERVSRLSAFWYI